MTDGYDPNDPYAGVPSYEDLSDLRGDEPLPQLEPPGYVAEPPRSPLLTGLVLGLLLVVVSIALFQLLRTDDEATAPQAALSTTVAAEGADDPTAGDPTGTTSAGETPGPVSDFDPYVAVGEPITIEELTLEVGGIGDIEFGQPGSEAIGRLIASLGDPDEDTGPVVSDGSWGTCVGDTERIVTWGPFAAIVVVDPDGTETFAGYRLDLALRGFSHPAADLATLSGLQVGRSYRQLEQIYADFEVRQVQDAELGTIWELESTNTGNLLLYGPLTTEETVRGIYSLDACDRF